MFVSLPLVAVAYLDGTLAVYDLSTQVLRHRCQHEVRRRRGDAVSSLCASPPPLLPFPLVQAGIVHLQWEESSSVVSTCSLDGALRLWDARSGNMVSEYRGHSGEILDFSVSRYERVPTFGSRLSPHRRSFSRPAGTPLSPSQPPGTTRPKCSASNGPIDKRRRHQ